MSMGELALWVAAIGLLAFNLVPPLAFALRLGDMQFELVEDATLAEFPITDPEGVAKGEQLAACGFRPVGLVMTRAICFCYHWTWQCPSRLFWTSDRRTVATVFRISRFEPPRVMLGSLVGRDWIVATSMPGEEESPSSPIRSLQTVASTTIAAMAAAHQALVERVETERGERATAIDLAHYFTLDLAADDVELGLMGRGFCLTLLVVTYAFVVAFDLGRNASFGPLAMWHVAEALLLGGLAYIALMRIWLAVLFVLVCWESHRRKESTRS